MHHLVRQQLNPLTGATFNTEQKTKPAKTMHSLPIKATTVALNMVLYAS